MKNLVNFVHFSVDIKEINRSVGEILIPSSFSSQYSDLYYGKSASSILKKLKKAF